MGLFKLRVPTKVTSKRINQAKYFYRTSISRASTHPQYWNLIHIKYPIINFFYSIMTLSFLVSTFNAHTYFFAISEKHSHENMQKILRTTHNLFDKWGKSKPSGQETVLFLMRSCSIQSFVLHSDNDHMQKSTSCDLRLSIWRWIKLQQYRDDKRNQSLDVVSGKNVNQRNFFSCLAQAMATCKKMASCTFHLNTWRQIKYQRNCNDKKAQLPNLW